MLTFQQQKFKKLSFIMYRNSPFLIMIMMITPMAMKPNTDAAPNTGLDIHGGLGFGPERAGWAEVATSFEASDSLNAIKLTQEIPFAPVCVGFGGGEVFTTPPAAGRGGKRASP